MRRTILVSIIIALVLISGISANAEEKENNHADVSDCIAAWEQLISEISTDAEEKENNHVDVSDRIAACEQFGSYKEIAEALFCAACIPYGKSPEDCVAKLQSAGFNFEYEIYPALPNDVSTFDVTYNMDGTPELSMMREVSLTFSPTVALYLRTKSTPIALASAAEEYADRGVAVTEDMEFWKLAEDLPEGKIIAAHLQYFDENTQEWITWTFMSPDKYKAK